MNWISLAAVALVTYLVVFLEALGFGWRSFLRTQIDFLPALMAYASLTGNLPAMGIVALLGGLWFDSLSANPLGVTVLPLLLVGAALYWRREIVLREQVYAQYVLGLAASAAVPVLELFLLYSLGAEPLVGSAFLWQWLVMILGGGLVTPAFFWLFGLIDRTFSHPPAPETSFREDREIKRGKA